MEKKKMSRDESKFIFDERNILNCGECPYNMEITPSCSGRYPWGSGDNPYKSYATDRVHPCNQKFCWIEIACDDETYRN